MIVRLACYLIMVKEIVRPPPHSYEARRSSDKAAAAPRSVFGPKTDSVGTRPTISILPLRFRPIAVFVLHPLPCIIKLICFLFGFEDTNKEQQNDSLWERRRDRRRYGRCGIKC